MITTAEMLAIRGMDLIRKHAYLLAVAMLAGLLMSALIPDFASAKCQPPGVPERAGSGVPGLLDSRDSTMGGNTLYGDYGYAGLKWHACDLGGPIAGNEWAGDPDAMMDTTIGNAGLGLSKWLAAAVTGLHSWNANTSDVLQPLDDMITKLSDLVRELVVDQWMIMFLLLAAVSLFAWAVTNEVRKTMMTLGSFLAAVGFLAIVGSQPLTVAHAIDEVGNNVTTTADQRALEVAGIDAEPDEAIGAIMNDRILYPLWAKGALGKDDQTKAGEDTWANDLYKASASTYDDADVDPDKKKKEYEKIYDDLGDSEDPSLQQYMKGQGYNRAGIGLASLIQTSFVSVIRIAAEALIFASKMIFRFIPIIGPVFAVLGVWHKTRAVAKEGLNMVGAAVINVLIFGVVAALHTALIAFLSNNLGFAPMLFISAIVTWVFWKFTKPFRSLTQMVSPSAVQQSMHGSVPGMNPMSTILSAWALLNTGRGNKSEKDAPGERPSSPQDRIGDDEEYVDPSQRQHSTISGPSYTDDAPALPIGSAQPHPIAPQGGNGAAAILPQRENLALEPDYDAPEPAYAPPRNTPGSDQGWNDDEVLHRVETSDNEAAYQRQDDHNERLMGDRIVAAIDRSSANTKEVPQQTQIVSQTGEVVEGNPHAPQVVEMQYDPQQDYYFDPTITTETRTDFNQDIFVPGNQTYYQRTDSDSDSVTRQNQE